MNRYMVTSCVDLECILGLRCDIISHNYLCDTEENQEIFSLEYAQDFQRHFSHFGEERNTRKYKHL